jgi:hypothetical protein
MVGVAAASVFAARVKSALVATAEFKVRFLQQITLDLQLNSILGRF